MTAQPAVELGRSLDTMLRAQLDTFPESATRLGLDSGDHIARRSRLDAASADALGAYNRRQRGFAQALRDIDPRALSPMQQIDREAVLSQTEALLEGARLLPQGTPLDCQPYVVTQLSGAYQSLPDLLCTKHPLDSADDAHAFLARLAAFGPTLRDEAARIEADAAAGVLPPAFVIDTTVRQLQRLLDTAAADSPIVQALGQRTQAAQIACQGSKWAEKATALVQQKPSARGAGPDDPVARAAHARQQRRGRVEVARRRGLVCQRHCRADHHVHECRRDSHRRPWTGD